MAERRIDPTELAALAVATLVGGGIRLFGVIRADFPLNDGGLFYRMILDLQATWPALPEITTFNGLGAPFAYPPLAFYLGAVLEPWLGVDVLRVVPVIAAILTVPAFHLLARSILGPGVTALAATGIFAVMPRTFEWMTMGGGLTRSLGLLLAILALWLTHRVLRGRGGWATVLAAGIAGGSVALTHPQAALFTVLTGMLLTAWHLRDRATLLRVTAAVAVALLVTLPWLIAIAARGQLDAVLSAGSTQPGPFIGLLSLLSFNLTGSRLFDVTALLTAVGLLLAVIRGRWLAPAWLAMVLVLDSRGGATYASIPASILAGAAFVDLLVRPFWERVPEPSAERRSSLPRLAPARALLAALLVAVAVTDAAGSQLAPTWAGYALTPEQRAAIESAGDVAPDGAVLVVSGRYWPVDATAEWFPVLAGSTSVATVQGHEWLGADRFAASVDAAEDLRPCALADAACLQAWADTWDVEFSHVFVPTGSLEGEFGDPECCSALRLLLAQDPGYRVVADEPGGILFERLTR